MIGLSISLCVVDIMRGKVKEREVEKIISGTMCSTMEHWEQTIDSYCERHWRENTELARGIAWRLVGAGIIDQPRLRGQEPPLYKGDIWVTHESQIDYKTDMTTYIEARIRAKRERGL